MKRFILIGLLAMLPATAFGQTKGELAEQNVVMHLNHLHQTPAFAELVEISPDARKIVERVARTTDGIGQSRAIEVLAEIGDREARNLLKTLLDDTKTREIKRHALVRVLVTRFGELSIGKTWLQNEDMQRRLTAIDALGQVDTPASLAMLEAHLLTVKSDVEKNATFKALEHVR